MQNEKRKCEKYEQSERRNRAKRRKGERNKKRRNLIRADFPSHGSSPRGVRLKWLKKSLPAGCPIAPATWRTFILTYIFTWTLYLPPLHHTIRLPPTKPLLLSPVPRNSSRIRFLLFSFCYPPPRKTGVCCVFSSRFLCAISIVFVHLFVPPLYSQNVKCELLVCVPRPCVFLEFLIYTTRFLGFYFWFGVSFFSPSSSWGFFFYLCLGGMIPLCLILCQFYAMLSYSLGCMP